MLHKPNSRTETTCPVCYVEHDQEIHEATLRIRGWFHDQIRSRLDEEEFFGAATHRRFDKQVA